MSIDICKYCGLKYDQDYNVEHEDECEENPDNMEEEETLNSIDRF